MTRTPAPTTVRRHPKAGRILAFILMMGCGTVLAIAAWLSPTGGLHAAVGWPQCGFKLVTRLPCVTCGMTTAVSFAAEGDLVTAMQIQPAGAFLALGLAVGTIIFAHATISGCTLAPLAKALCRPRVIIGAIAWLVISWIYTLATTLFGEKFVP